MVHTHAEPRWRTIPEFQNFDGDTYMAEHYSANEPLNKILDQLVKNVESLVQVLRELPDEAWSRKSSHVRLWARLYARSLGRKRTCTS